jgi:hypothetical protein
VDFIAKKLCKSVGEIIDGSIAYLEPEGGDTVEVHTNDHNKHLLIVSQGQAKAILKDKKVILNKDESLLMDGKNSTFSME